MAAPSLKIAASCSNGGSPIPAETAVTVARSGLLEASKNNSNNISAMIGKVQPVPVTQLSLKMTLTGGSMEHKFTLLNFTDQFHVHNYHLNIEYNASVCVCTYV